MKISSIYFLLLLVMSCQKEEVQTKPIAIKLHHQCAVDGMIIQNFEGPKAQVHFKGNEKSKIDFYCETVEMFNIYLEPGMSARIKSLFVQDSGKITWEKPVGEWIKAKDAFYVVGSKREGAMGKTYASFLNKKDAVVFSHKYGGEVLNFDEVLIKLKRTSAQ